MAKNNDTSGNTHSDDYTTGRPCKDPQMHALKKVLGTPARQATLPPYLSAEKLPVDPKVETD